MGECVDVTKESGESFAVYLPVPKQGSGPGVVLLQEIFGINDYMRDMADRDAEESHVVLVPDLFWPAARRIEPGFGDWVVVAVVWPRPPP
ncbi:dienelactone hydrolase family protein [Nocardia sp. CA-151230]|uniref:dienelactone hydrolase family protein n=1 Tax=Nocardia sp. CA-151230 TaxID=3239982 RepID=UPI003D8EA827